MRFQLILVFSMISLSQSKSKCFYYSDREFEDACYIFVDQGLTFWEAQKYCNYQVHTWTILTKVNNTIISNWLARIGESYFGTRGNFWIGVYRPTVYDNFRTMDGKTCTYTNFEHANPSMDYAIESVVNGKWDTRPEELLFPFVCSYYPPKIPTTTETSPLTS